MGLRSCAQGGFVPSGYHCSARERGCPSCPRTQHEVGCPWAPDTRGAIPGPALLSAPSHNLHPAACGPRVHGPPLSHPSWSPLPHLLAETLRPMRVPVGLGDTAGAGWGRAVVLPGPAGVSPPPAPCARDSGCGAPGGACSLSPCDVSHMGSGPRGVQGSLGSRGPGSAHL